MSNFLGNITLALKLKLGYIPSTASYEARLQKSWADVDFFQHYPTKEVWREYERLKGLKQFSKKEEQKAAKNKVREIENSPEYKRYRKLAKSSAFSTQLKFEQTFFDNFDGMTIDNRKWLPKYFWGEKLLGKGYSHTEELHHYTEGENLAIKNGKLTIKTKDGEHTAMSWDKKFGFMPRKCSYTSGIVNTGHSFRQQYGRFEAKISFNRRDNVYNSFWMIGDNSTPHLNVFKLNHNLELGLINDINKSDISKVSSDLLKENSYVVSLEWSPKEIRWRLNGVTVKRITSNLPNNPLYLVFSSGVQSLPTGKVDNDFVVEWVRCYKKNR